MEYFIANPRYHVLPLRNTLADKSFSLLNIITVPLSANKISNNFLIWSPIPSILKFPSVQFCHSVVSNCLQCYGLQHARPPCPSPTPGACPSSCPSSWWCHPSTSSSVVPFSSCLRSFPESGSFPESVLHIRWPEYWSFSFSISPSREYSELISLRMDWLDLLAVQGALKSQHHSSKASLLWCSVFFVVQLSYPYMMAGKTIALTGWT